MNTILIISLLGDPMLPAASSDRTGGFNVDVNELITFLSDKQYQCLVITDMSYLFPVEHEIINDNIDLYRVSIMGADINNQQSLFAKVENIYSQITDILHKTGFKPVLIHSYYWLSGYIAGMLANSLSIPFVHSIVALAIDKEKSGAESDYSAQLASERTFLHHAKYVFAITGTEKKTALHEYHLHEDRVIVVGRDVDRSYLFPARNELGVARKFDASTKIYHTNSTLAETNWWNNGAFTYTGRLKREKGVHYIAQAWRLLRDQYGDLVPPLWIIGGDIEMIERMRDIVHRLIPDLLDYERNMQICWWGHLDSEAISGIYLKTIVFIAHSQYEAGGRVIIEAMSQKKPVIATPVGFAADFIHDWVNGFLVKFGDVEQLSKRMAHFVRQPILANTLGNSAKETIDRVRRSWNYYEQINAIYSKFISNHHSSFKISEDDTDDTGITDYFNLGMISTYPYAYNRFLRSDGIYMEYPRTFSIEKPSRVHNAIISQTDLNGSPRLQIRYYSELNKAKLWNSFVDTEVHLGSIRYDKALSSSFSPATVSVIESKREELQIEIPVLPIVEDRDIYFNHEMMIDLLYTFNRSTNLPGINNFKPISYLGTNSLSLNTMFNELLSQPILPTWPPKLVTLYKKESVFIRDVIDCLPDGTSIYGVNYGKSLAKNVVVSQNGTYLLLPSTGIYYGEIGYDIGLYLYDVLKSDAEFTPQAFFEFTNAAARSYGYSPKYFTVWALLVVFERLLSSNVMLLEDDSRIDIKIWNNLKQFIRNQ